MLSEYIDIREDKDHDLPWYPPICKHPDMEEDESYLPSSIRRVIDRPLRSHPILQKQLLGYINKGKSEEAEIGQRIISAMSKVSADGWSSLLKDYNIIKIKLFRISQKLFFYLFNIVVLSSNRLNCFR